MNHWTVNNSISSAPGIATSERHFSSTDLNTFTKQENGQKHRTPIVAAIEDCNYTVE
jgi:hypothetical protein